MISYLRARVRARSLTRLLVLPGAAMEELGALHTANAVLEERLVRWALLPPHTSVTAGSKYSRQAAQKPPQALPACILLSPYNFDRPAPLTRRAVYHPAEPAACKPVVECAGSLLAAVSHGGAA